MRSSAFFEVEAEITAPDLANRFVYTPERGVQELGEVDVLYRNQGGTNFVPVSFTDGTFLDEDRGSGS